MIAVVQRASSGSVEVEGRLTGRIGTGLVILLGVVQNDTKEDAVILAEKISKLRIFNDEFGKMNLSIKDVEGDALVISQFTLAGNCKKGNRPSFTDAASPQEGEALYEYFSKMLKERGIKVENGIFGAMMEVKLVNDGPVTFVLDSKILGKKTGSL